MKSKIIVLRHGETESNLNKKYCGWTNIALNETGKKQIENLKESLKGVSKIYSSDLLRCRESSEIILAFLNVPVKYLKNLREINFGDFENKTYKDIKEEYPKELEIWEKQALKYKFPNGESLKDLKDRFISEFENIKKEAEGKKILIVTHSGCMRLILSHYFGREDSYWKFKIKTAGKIEIVFYDNYPVLLSLN